MRAEGGCYCGAVRYQVDGETIHRTLCHCDDCRRISGAPVLAWFSVEPGALRFSRGVPVRFRSSEHVTRGFCGICGTTLTFEDARWPGEVDITTASLDDPEMAPPEDHSYVPGRLEWLRTADGLPEYARTRSGKCLE
ncbi:MAG: GFA family protein [Massilia sp.]